MGGKINILHVYQKEIYQNKWKNFSRLWDENGIKDELCNFNVIFCVESCDFSSKILIFSWMTNENKNEIYPQNFICPSYEFNYHVNWKIEKRLGKKTQLLLHW